MYYTFFSVFRLSCIAVAEISWIPVLHVVMATLCGFRASRGFVKFRPHSLTATAGQTQLSTHQPPQQRGPESIQEYIHLCNGNT
jgi:hypothetical protein